MESTAFDMGMALEPVGQDVDGRIRPISELSYSPTVRVIGLFGYARSGKDESARGLASLEYKRVSFADPLRTGLLAINPYVDYECTYTCDGYIESVRMVRLQEMVEARGWEGAKEHPETRRLLQSYGSEGGRDIHGSDAWTRIAKQVSDEILAAGGKVVFTDCRFQEEVDLVKSYGGIMVRVTKPGVGPVNNHKSDNFQITPDVIVENTGTVAELHDKIRAVAGQFQGWSKHDGRS